MQNYPVIAEGYGVYITPKGGQILKRRDINSTKRFVKRCKTLNIQAGAILEQCTGFNTIKDIVGILEKKFEDTPPDLQTQIQEFLDEAFQNGYIQYSDKKEKKGLIKGSTDYFIPLSVLFEITTNCNLKCEHCLLSAGELREDELSASQIISALERLSQLGVTTVDISGGEMLTKKGWEKIIDFCKDTFILSILTNGISVTEEIAATLSFSDRVSISLYGADAETHDKVTGVKGSFEQVLRGATILTKRDIEVRAAILIFPFNVYQLEDIVKLAIFLGCKRVQVGIICSVGRAENKNWDLSEKERAWLDRKMKELKEREEYKDIEIRWEEEDEEHLEKKENKCGAGVIMWEITSNGDIYPCATVRIPMGNVAKENLEDICKSSAAKFFQDLLTPHKKLCGDCQYLYLCKGCHGQAFAHFFKVDNCPWVKQFEKAPPLFKNAIHEKYKRKK